MGLIHQKQLFDEEKDKSLQEIIFLLKDSISNIAKNWLMFLVIFIAFLSYLLYDYSQTDITYSAELSFIVNEDETGLSSAGASAGILKEVGINRTKKHNFDRITYIARSERILQRALLTKGEINGVIDFYANHIIKAVKLHHRKWNNNEQLSSFLFSNANLDSFSNIEKMAMKDLTELFLGKDRRGGLLISNYSYTSEIMRVELTTPVEEISIKLSKEFFLQVSNFYTEKAIEKQKYSYKVITEKADSLRRQLNNSEYSRAKDIDSNRGIILETNQVPIVQNERKLSLLNALYEETIRDAEVADFAIKSKIPFLQIIDEPIAPLKPNKKNLNYQIIVSIALTLIIISILITLKKLLKFL